MNNSTSEVGFSIFLDKISIFSSFKQIIISNFRMKKCHQVPVEIRQIYLKPDRNRNRILKPEIRPEPDSAGFPVGSLTVQCRPFPGAKQTNQDPGVRDLALISSRSITLLGQSDNDVMDNDIILFLYFKISKPHPHILTD